METKKSSRADLENKKSVFLQAGLIVALSVALLAFEWESPVSHTISLNSATRIDWIEDLAPITRPELPKPKAIPPSFTRIEIVDKPEVAAYETPDAGTNEMEAIPEYIPPKRIEIQEENDLPDPEEIFHLAEVQPEYPGGYDELRRFLYKNLVYPDLAKTVNMQGTVYVSFVVEKDGSLTDIKIERGIGGGCDEEVIRVLKMMPRWSPGLQRTKPVRVLFSLPVVFTLK